MARIVAESRPPERRMTAFTDGSLSRGEGLVRGKWWGKWLVVEGRGEGGVRGCVTLTRRQASPKLRRLRSAYTPATDADYGNLLQHPGGVDPCRAALRLRPADRL